jgi:hypothetical protein
MRVSESKRPNCGVVSVLFDGQCIITRLAWGVPKNRSWIRRIPPFRQRSCSRSGMAFGLKDFKSAKRIRSCFHFSEGTTNPRRMIF